MGLLFTTKKDRLAEFKKRLEKASIKVGILSNSNEPHKGSKISVLGIANVHEYGAPERGIPARPFIGGWFESNGAAAQKKLASTLKTSVLKKGISFRKALTAAGAWLVGQVQYAMVRTEFAALSPRTIARKKSSKPLIDTGQLRSSIAFSVNSGRPVSPLRVQNASKAKKKALRNTLKKVKKAVKNARKTLRKSLKGRK